MSEHWQPDEQVSPLRPAGARRELARLHGRWRTEVRSLPHGSRAGLVLVAAACVGVAAGLYLAFGPREVVASEARAEWSDNRR